MYGLAAGILTPFMMFAATTIQGNVCDPIMQPTITTPQNGSTLQPGSAFVGGGASHTTTVRVKVDGATAATTTAGSSDTYGATVTLQPGEHTIDVESSSVCESKSGPGVTVHVSSPSPDPDPVGPTPGPQPQPVPSGPSTGYTAYYRPDDTTRNQVTKKGLTLTLDPALDGSSVSDTEVYLSGILSQSGIVEIIKDGEVIARLERPAKLFGFTIPLELGSNTFTIRATRGDTVVEKEVTIIRVAPGSASGSTDNDSGTDKDEKGTGSIWKAIVAGAAVTLGAAAATGLFLLATKRRKKDDQTEEQP